MSYKNDLQDNNMDLQTVLNMAKELPNAIEIVQSTGDSETVVMSQKAVTEALDEIDLKTPKNLTEAQKKQARDNIGVENVLESVGGDTLTWDGNTEGLVNLADTFFKVPNAVPPTPDELLNGATVKMSQFAGLSPEISFTEIGQGFFISTNSECVVIQESAVGIEIEGIIPQEPGVYLVNQGGIFVSSLTIPGYTGFAKKQIKEEYIPESVPNIQTAAVGQTIVVSEVDSEGKPTKWEAREAGGGASVEPAEDDIPKVYFTGTLPTSKAEEDARLTMHYRSKTADFIYPVTLKVQGSSSANYAKKNFTLKPYKDNTYEKKQKLAFKNWPEMNKFVLKAHWIDHSHVRNVGTAKLWGKVVASRSDYNSLPEELRNSPNNGATDGFTVKVFANGVYQGLYEWIVAKDKLFGQDSDIATHSILNSELNNQPTCAFATTSPAINGNWSEELQDSMSPAISTSFANLIKFVAGSTDEEFVVNAESYFDVQSVIDYSIFARIFCIVDNLCRNQIFFTYDGVKWYEGVWDVDAILGLPPTVRGFFAYNTEFQSGYIAYKDYGVTNLLYQRVENLFLERFKARYAELRSGVLSVDNIIDVYERLTDTITTYDGLLEEDYAATTGGGAFTGIPYTAENNIQQIRNFVAQRTAYMDGVVENMTGETGGSGESGDGADDYETVNILDSVAWEFGMINGINGSDIANTEWIRTAYFDFSEYAGATVGVTTNETPTARFAVYNADKTNIQAAYDATGQMTEQICVIPDAAKYARVSAMVKTGTANKEDTVALYVMANVNMLDSTTEVIGKYYHSVSGELTDSSIYNAKRIAVNSAALLFVNAESVVFQSEDGSVTGANTVVQYKDTLLRPPVGTKYVCVNYRVEKSSSVYVRKAVEIGRRQISGNDW